MASEIWKLKLVSARWPTVNLNPHMVNSFTETVAIQKKKKMQLHLIF